MAVPVYKGTGTVFGTPGGAATTAAIAAPASIAVDDILYLIALTNGSTTLSSLPSGWAHVTGSPVTSTGGSNNATLNVCWKRAVAGDVGAVSYTFTLSASDYCEGAISNASGVNNSGSPWDTSTGAPTFAKTSAATTTAPAVSLTTQGADRLIVNGALNQTGGTPWTASSGYTKDFDHTGGGSFSTATGYHVGQATAGSTGSVAPTCPASGEMVNFLGALIPAGSSTPITLTEAGSASDVATVSATVPLSESGSASEAPKVNATVPITDTASSTDALAITATIHLADTATAADTFGVVASLALADTAAGADAISVNTGGVINKALTDSGSAFDSLCVETLRPNTGIAARPSTGTTARPNTGTTNPC